MRQVEGEGLVLRPLQVEHAAEMFELLSDPAIYEYENQPPSSLGALATRYARLEARQSPDGAERWLNWVVALPDGALAGYVQATVHADRTALVGYELASAFWHRGIGSRAVHAMIGELRDHYAVETLFAVLKRINHRSRRLLVGQGFAASSVEERARFSILPDEDLMEKRLAEDRDRRREVNGPP